LSSPLVKTYGDFLTNGGDFTPWFDFFFDGVKEQAQAAEERAVRLVDIRSDLHEGLLKAKVSNACHKLGDRLLANPFVTARSVRQHISVSPPTAHATIARLVELGILREVTGRVRNRIYIATEIFDAVYAGVGTPAGSR
jgi:Fic family protein